jgi:hypothetical protein
MFVRRIQGIFGEVARGNQVTDTASRRVYRAAELLNPCFGDLGHAVAADLDTGDWQAYLAPYIEMQVHVQLRPVCHVIDDESCALEDELHEVLKLLPA